MIVYNLKNVKKEDFTTTYTLSSDRSFSMPITDDSSVSVEVIWGEFDYLGTTYGTDLDDTDATAILQVSADGENVQNHPTMSTIVMNAVSGASGWQTDKWIDRYLHVAVTKNSVTSGTIRILVTTKD